MHNLSELQQDALLEIFNVSIGRAASAMSDMVSETINMSVPAMQFLTRKEAGDILDLKGRRRICSVAQGFAGSFSGEAVLMFPEENSLEIVRMMLGSTIPLAHLTELEQDALNEVGNIILNSCISAFADNFHEQFDTTLPEVRVGSGMEAV
ncbi:MAG: chemotaxis protein CheX, partial [Burkholderiales bacterium]